MARYRKRMSRKSSKRSFRKHSGSHKRNFRSRSMRGGIRL